MSQVDLQVRSRSRAAGLLLCAFVVTAPLAAEGPIAPQAEAATVAPPATPQAVLPAVRLEPAVVPAAGRQSALLEVADFGRYAIRIASSRGTTLQVVDRMSGAGEIAGEAGKVDGRVDLFLDRGEVRILTDGSKLATGEATLSVTPFRERGADAATGAAPPAVQLVEGKAVDGELADLEQLSWWLEIPKRRRVVFEAAGRNLADLRLWQNGSWLVDVAPVTSVVEPQERAAAAALPADRRPHSRSLSSDRLRRTGGARGPLQTASSSGRSTCVSVGRATPSRCASAARSGRSVSTACWCRRAADYFRLELPEPLAAGEAEVELAVADARRAGSPFSVSGS
jgi:hypothetical protein